MLTTTFVNRLSINIVLLTFYALKGDCLQHLTEPYGSVSITKEKISQFPGEPCNVVVSVASDKVILLKFGEFKKDIFTSVLIYDGPTRHGHQLLRYGNGEAFNLVTPQNTVCIRVTLGAQAIVTMEYETIDPPITRGGVACGSTIVSKSTLFDTPSWPSSTQVFVHCNLTFVVDGAQTLRLNVSQYKPRALERLIVHDNNANMKLWKSKRFDIHKAGIYLLASQSITIMEWMHYSHNNDASFKGLIEAGPPIKTLTGSCGSVYEAPNGILTSPNYTSLNGDIVVCNYFVQPKPHSLVHLTFLKFESNRGMKYDLKIEGKDGKLTPKVYTFVDGQKPRKTISMQGGFLVHFVSHLSNGGPVFRAIYISRVLTNLSDENRDSTTQHKLFL